MRKEHAARTINELGLGYVCIKREDRVCTPG